MGFRVWCAPDKRRKEEWWVSGCGVGLKKVENRNRGFQVVVCAKQMERKGMVGFETYCASGKEGEEK